jgi:hypothetical protein
VAQTVVIAVTGFIASARFVLAGGLYFLARHVTRDRRIMGFAGQKTRFRPR